MRTSGRSKPARFPPYEYSVNRQSVPAFGIPIQCSTMRSPVTIEALSIVQTLMSTPAKAAPSRAKRNTARATPRPVVHVAALGPRDLDDPELFINRELSLLDFQRRVLEEAQDSQQSLAGATDVPVLRGLECRRVLHGAGGRPEAAGRKGRERHRSRRNELRRSSCAPSGPR